MQLVQIDICMCKHNGEQKCFRSLIQLLRVNANEMNMVLYMGLYNVSDNVHAKEMGMIYADTDVIQQRSKYWKMVTFILWEGNVISLLWPGDHHKGPGDLLPSTGHGSLWRLDNPKVFSPKTADRWPVLASLHKTHFSVLFMSNGPLI